MLRKMEKYWKEKFASNLAIVNKVIPFSTVDGPGNRTAIFLQGCNMNCKYCHNPETRGICVHCGACQKVCPTGALFIEDNKVCYDQDKCTQCDACIRSCPHDSSPKTRRMSPEEVFNIVRKQIPFIRGITVSGGECTLYPVFLTELFTLCKSVGLSTLIDSSGTLEFKKHENLLKVTDGVMLDIKAFDKEQHNEVTGIENELILENAVYLAQLGKLTEVRTVVVPELFHAEDTVHKVGELLKPYLKINDIRYKIIAYRPMGVRSEYANYTIPTQEHLEDLADIVREKGFQNIIII